MIEFRLPPAETRDAIREAIPADAALYGSPPEARYLRVPRAHAQALDLDTVLVVGARGAGKTLWHTALRSAAHRAIVRLALPRTGITDTLEASAGFGSARSASHPSAGVLRALRPADPRAIWRATVLWNVTGDGERPDIPGWSDRIAWVESHAEASDRALLVAEERLRRLDRHHLVVFDALDQLADDWADVRRLLRALLEVGLALRSFERIRAKIFVRPDLLADPEVTAFRDAAKLLAGRAELAWPRAELYSLLWQYLGNAPIGGSAFREETQPAGRVPAWRQLADRPPIWQPPRSLLQDEEIQRRVFHAIAGPFMGTHSSRGFPYTWLPNRLADGSGRVTPRSFLSAVRAAAVDPASAGHRWALHFEALKHGVQAASARRVQEIEEDYPWVAAAMAPLRRLSVPCDRRDLEQRWAAENVLAAVGKSSGLSPRRAAEGPRGLAADLVDLGVFRLMGDGRVNMPDVYRIGFGLGRRGGVPPVK